MSEPGSSPSPALEPPPGITPEQWELYLLSLDVFRDKAAEDVMAALALHFYNGAHLIETVDQADYMTNLLATLQRSVDRARLLVVAPAQGGIH